VLHAVMCNIIVLNVLLVPLLLLSDHILWSHQNQKSVGTNLYNLQMFY
jgi:hypothetical protein